MRHLSRQVVFHGSGLSRQVSLYVVYEPYSEQVLFTVNE